jgi:hypothetical protein
MLLTKQPMTNCPNMMKPWGNCSVPGAAGDSSHRQQLMVQESQANVPTSATQRKQKDMWKIGWVCDRCFNPESEVHLQEMQQTVANIGGTLKIFKKGLQFAHWFKWGSAASEFFLIATWRETKPCFHIMMQQKLPAWPACTVILCADAQQRARATAWAKGMPNFIYVYEESSLPPSSFNRLLHFFGSIPRSNGNSVVSCNPTWGSGSHPCSVMPHGPIPRNVGDANASFANDSASSSGNGCANISKHSACSHRAVFATDAASYSSHGSNGEDSCSDQSIASLSATIAKFKLPPANGYSTETTSTVFGPVTTTKFVV